MSNNKIETAVLSVYKELIPEPVREKITMYRDAGGLNTLRKKILSYYADMPAQNLTSEQSEVMNYLKKHPVKTFPYTFPKKYNRKNIKVYLDETNGLLYVLHDNKKLYFKRSWTRSDVRNNYNDLLIEQDEQSPHRYLNEDFYINQGSVVVDIGTAEGNFALSVIDKVSMMYLFETDNEWIEALNATFAPWSNKVKIINKYVSDHDDDHSISLNSYFGNGEKVDFLKIDVDGAELKLLNGSSEILNRNSALKVAICTYHRQQDEKIFTNFLKAAGFEVNPSNGYMIFIYDKEFEAPYLRRGLLRAEKKMF